MSYRLMLQATILGFAGCFLVCDFGLGVITQAADGAKNNTQAPVGAGAVEGYSDHASLTQRLKKLVSSNAQPKEGDAKQKLSGVSLRSLAKTPGRRDVWLLTIHKNVTARAAASRPAVLIVGNVHGPHLAGGELAIQLAEQLVGAMRDDANPDDTSLTATKAMLDQYTFYFICQPNPDASAGFFRKPFVERTGNDRIVDSDRDFKKNEDDVDDLNEDGWITMLLIKDATGEWVAHPKDPRVMVKVDFSKNERGQYKLLPEGLDNDDDEKFNEDGIHAQGGVDFNRNFTFKYPYLQAGAGRHQVSEPETRAVADFCFDHPNIVAVFSFSPEDNLFHPRKPDGKSDGARIKTAIHSKDAPFHDFVAERYRKLHGAKDAPTASKGAGSFSDWAYFHYGRWSFTSRGWWVPKVAVKQTKSEEKKPGKGTVKDKDVDKDEDKSADDELDGGKNNADASETVASKEANEVSETDGFQVGKRGDADLNKLRWLDSKKIAGFVNWTRVKHPGFPGKIVEIGGFKPFLLTNPPVAELEPLAKKHVAFLQALTKLLPRVKVHELKVESLDGGVFRVTAEIINEGYLPTSSEMGRLSRKTHPLQVEIKLSGKEKFVSKFIQGHRRNAIDKLDGGKSREMSWLVQTNLSQGQAGQLVIRVSAPTIKTVSRTATLKEGK